MDYHKALGDFLYQEDLLACPKIKEIPMDPRVGGSTPFKYNKKDLEPYDFIIINPINVDFFTWKVKKYLRTKGLRGKELSKLTNYYRQEYINYLIEHEIDHWKSLKYDSEYILKLIEKYGPYWRPIAEGITEERVIRKGYKKGVGRLRELFSPYPYERKLVRELAKGDKEVEEALKKDYNLDSCFMEIIV